MGEKVAPRTNACLVFVSGPKLGVRFDVKGDKTTLGTNADCDIRLEDKSISGEIGEISLNGESLHLRRSKGEGKLLVEGEEVDECTLRDGQLLRIGNTVFKVLISSELERAYHEQIYWLMTHDATTGLFNKRYFLESLERQMSRARRWNTPLSVAVLQMESSERSAKRDNQIKEIADTLFNSARSDDVIARADEDTFALALYRTHPDGAEVLCSRILDALSPDAPQLKLAIASMDVTSPNATELLEAAMAELE